MLRSITFLKENILQIWAWSKTGCLSPRKKKYLCHMGTNKLWGSYDCNRAEDAGVVCPLSTKYVHVA